MIITNSKRINYNIGDLVCEKHHSDWLGVVIDTYDKNINTDYKEQIIVVEWIKNPNNVDKSSREEISSKYLQLMKRG